MKTARKKPPTKVTTVNIVTDGFYEPVAFVGDLQAPFQDDLTLMALERFLKEFQPRKLIHVGDGIDMYAISAYNRDPERRFKLQEEIDESTAIWKRWRDLLPSAEFHYHFGNHEDRLRRYLWSQAPELESLDVLDLPKLLHCKEFGIKTYEYGQGQYLSSQFFIEHGDRVRQHSGYTAKAMMDRRGMSGISGHTHRLGTFYRRDRGGTYVWLENGCLARLDPEYDAFPNWQQGFTIGWFKKSGRRFHVEQIPITDHAFVYSGRRYGVSNG